MTGTTPTVRHTNPSSKKGSKLIALICIELFLLRPLSSLWKAKGTATEVKSVDALNDSHVALDRDLAQYLKCFLVRRTFVSRDHLLDAIEPGNHHT